MKVLLVNGSPHETGCTFTALAEVAGALEQEGVETELFQAGSGVKRGCKGCGGCSRSGTGRCVFDDDCVNQAIEKAEQADGFVFGSPVHYAAASGDLTAFLDRCFYAGSRFFAYKPGAAVVSCRRGGATAAFDQLNKYFTISNMPIVSSQYWNMVHGNTPEEVKQDLEGLQGLRMLGRNMAWLLRCIEAGAGNGMVPPVPEPRLKTNFIR